MAEAAVFGGGKILGLAKGDLTGPASSIPETPVISRFPDRRFQGGAEAQ